MTTDTPKTYDYSDVGNAERWRDERGDLFRAVREREGRSAKDGWIAWDKDAGVWRADHDGAVLRSVMGMTEEMLREAELALVEAAAIDEGDKQDAAIRSAKALHAWATRSRSSRALLAVLTVARSLDGMTVREADLDANHHLMCLENGTLDLRTPRTLRESRPEDLITIQVSITYDPDAWAGRWERFLHEVFPEDRELWRYLRLWVGYCLTGRTDAQTFHVFHGAGANGKSVFLAVLRGLLGDLCREAAPSAFVQNGRFGDANRHGLAGLRGARVVTTTEVRGDGVLDLATVKATTGGDQVTCRHLYGQYFSYVPTFKPVLVCNAKPRIKEDSQGVWRRLRLIPFAQSFTGAACDPNLTDRLLAELPGILNWALFGLESLAEDGWGTVPPSVAVATEDYRADESPVTLFLAETYDESGAWQSSSDIYRTFRAWQAARGDRPWSRRALSSALAGHDISKGKQGANGTRGFYIGCPVRSDDLLDLDDLTLN